MWTHVHRGGKISLEDRREKGGELDPNKNDSRTQWATAELETIERRKTKWQRKRK